MIELPNLGRFLILYFIFSDGYSVIGSVSVSRFFLHAVFMAALFQCQPAQQRSHSSSQLGVLFALNEIGVPTSYLVLLLVETQALSLVGIALFERLGKWLQNSRGYTPSRSFIVIIAINLARNRSRNSLHPVALSRTANDAFTAGIALDPQSGGMADSHTPKRNVRERSSGETAAALMLSAVHHIAPEPRAGVRIVLQQLSKFLTVVDIKP
jgi:hypothetical protein